MFTGKERDSESGLDNFGARYDASSMGRFYRKKNGEPLTFRSQHARLVPLRVWFRWMTRQNHILGGAGPCFHENAPDLGCPSLPALLAGGWASLSPGFRECTSKPARYQDRRCLHFITFSGYRREAAARYVGGERSPLEAEL
ncbi:MAG TPA: hypothetical protein VIW68_09210, partial [Candidatus Sulfotelmatobacter sp.]